ncbi:MAG: ferritin-like domain-containing protein [Acidimicrobiales bacterium]|jgi:bacterioferritin
MRASADSAGGMMEKSELIDLLNEDLATEFQSIVQYTQHTASITGPEYLSTVDELKIHLTQELNHAQILAEQISFLGGTPGTKVAAVPAWTDSKGALEADLELETGQLDRYRQRFEQAMELGLADVAEALRPLLEQTQEHVRDLKGALGK